MTTQETLPALDARACGTVSDRLIQLYRETYGRGPTKGKAFAVDGALIAVMEDVLLPMERALAESGAEALVRGGRRHLRARNDARFSAEVERLTGLRVGSSESSFGFDPDYAIEVFRFEPDQAG